MDSVENNENSGLRLLNEVETPVVSKIDLDGPSHGATGTKPTPTSHVARSQAVKLITKQTRNNIYEGDAKQNRKRALTYSGGNGTPPEKHLDKKLWQQLRTQGWSKKGENPVCYCVPGCDTPTNGKEGIDYFTSEEQVLAHVYQKRTFTRVHNISPTLAGSLIDTASKEGSIVQAERRIAADEPVYFEALWPHLKEVGWRCLTGAEHGTFRYLLPNVKSVAFKDGENGFCSKERVVRYAKTHVPHAYKLALMSARRVSPKAALSKTCPSSAEPQQTSSKPVQIPQKTSVVFDVIWSMLSKHQWREEGEEACHFKAPNGEILQDEVEVVLYLEENLKHLLSGSILEEQESIATMLKTIMKESSCNAHLNYDSPSELLEYAEERLPAIWKGLLVNSSLKLFQGLSDVLGVVGVVKIEGPKRFTCAAGWNTAEAGLNSFENKFQVVCHASKKLGRLLDLSLKGIIRDRAFPQQDILSLLSKLLIELGWETREGGLVKPNDEKCVELSGKKLIEAVCRNMPLLYKTALLMCDYRVGLPIAAANTARAQDSSNSKLDSHSSLAPAAKPEPPKQKQAVEDKQGSSPLLLVEQAKAKEPQVTADVSIKRDAEEPIDATSPERVNETTEESQPVSQRTAPSSIARVGISQRDTGLQEEIFEFSPVAPSDKEQTPGQEAEEEHSLAEENSPVVESSPPITRSQKKAKKRKSRTLPIDTPSTRPKRRTEVSVRYCQGPQCMAKISAYGANYCSQNCQYRADKRRQEVKDLEEEKRRAKGRKKGNAKKPARYQASKEELKEFKTLWHLLETKGWKAGKERGKDVFVLPKVKKNKRVLGKNTFSTKDAVIEHVKLKNRLVYDSVYNAVEDVEEEEGATTPMINGIKARSRESCMKAKEFCKRNGQSSKTHLFNAIYKILKEEHGWKYFTRAKLESSYCYAMPHVKSYSAGTVGTDLFLSKDDVISHVQKHMKDVWLRVNGDFFLEIATPVSQLKRTRKRKVSPSSAEAQTKRQRQNKRKSTRPARARRSARKKSPSPERPQAIEDTTKLASGDEISDNDAASEAIFEEDPVEETVEKEVSAPEPVPKSELYRSTELRNAEEVKVLLTKRHIGRGEQVKELLAWIGTAEVDTGHFSIIGNVASGKTTVVKDLMSSLKLPHAFVDAKEVYDEGVLFRLVLAQMPEVVLHSSLTKLIDETVVEEEQAEMREYQKKRELQIMDNMRKLEEIFGSGTAVQASGEQGAAALSSDIAPPKESGNTFDEKASTRRIRCSTLSHFVLQLHARLRNHSETFYIVLDNVEKLDRQTLAGLLRLKRAAKVKLCVVLIAKSGSLMTALPDLQREIHFPDYSVAEVEAILSSRTPSSVHNEGALKCYRKLCTYTIGAFQQFVNDVRELSQLVETLWMELEKRTQEKAVPTDETTDLNTLLAPAVLMLSRQLFQGNHSVDNSLSTITEETLDLRERNAMNQAAELPYYAKILLVASYLASYNPKKHDTTLFGSVRRMSKASKRKKGLTRLGGATKNSKEVTPQTQLGPMSFTSERLFFIYRSLLSNLQGDKIADSAFSQKLYKQLLVLVDLQLLIKTSKEGELDEPTFKCYATHEYVGAVSKSVQLDLDKFMYH